MLLPILLMGFSKSDITTRKVFKESISVSTATNLKVTNDCGPIEFKTISGTEARFEATLSVDGPTMEEINKVINQFELSVSESGNLIDVSANDNVKDWIRVKALFVNKNTITFNDGTEAYGINEMDVSFVIYLPEISKLSIYNKYDEVKYDNFNFDVEANLFSSDFKGGDIFGELDMDLKYGDINIGNIQDGDFQLFDCDSKVLNAENLNLNIKYSDVEFKDIDNFYMTSFDDNVSIGNIKDNIVIDAKYSEIILKNFTKGDFEFFDCDVKAIDGKYLKLDSKYSDFEFNDIDSISIEFFQDKLKVGDVNVLNARNTKYSSIEIDKIQHSLKAIASFQDDFEIDVVGQNIKNLEIEGKYTDLIFPIPSDVSYFLDANLTYSNFSFPDSCDDKDRDNGDQAFNINCEVKSPTDKSLSVKLDLFDADVVIK